ncbi:hypothetical protein K439DRAFT_1643307 [Ramaria rubella]|nr:hypothetical protein K439DRAFT_1643307 [Ramaria rubella]
MWDRLKELHYTYDAFFSIRKEENESLTELTGHVSHAMAHIKSLRPLHFRLQQLDEELQSMALICALPLDYSSALHNWENQVRLRKNFASVPTIAMKASTISTTPSVVCGWCLYTGHAKENCYSKKLSQQRDQNTAASQTKRKSKAEKSTLVKVKEETASIMYAPHVVPIHLADDSVIYSAGIGLVVFRPIGRDGKEMDPVEFHDVLHVPAL